MLNLLTPCSDLRQNFSAVCDAFPPDNSISYCISRAPANLVGRFLRLLYLYSRDVEWIFYAPLLTFIHMSHNTKFSPPGSTRPTAGGRHAAVHITGSRKPYSPGWIAAMFYLETAAIVLTVSAVRHVLAETGEHGPIAVSAIVLCIAVLVGVTVKTVVAWRGLSTNIDR